MKLFTTVFDDIIYYLILIDAGQKVAYGKFHLSLIIIFQGCRAL